MARRVSREDEDRALFKFVGAILDSTTEKPRRRQRLLWLKGRRALRFKRKLRILVRRHPLVPASVGLCVIVWVCVTNVMRSTPEEATAASAPDRSKPLRVAHLENPHMINGGKLQKATQADLDRLRPLSYWLDRLQDPDWRVRSGTAFELVKQSRSSEVVLSALLLLLHDPHAGVRFWAADRFRIIGMYEQAVTSTMRGFAGNDELLVLYKESDSSTRERFLMVVRSWMTNLDDDVRWTGLTICGMLGSRAAVFEPTLEAIAKNDIHERYRKQARVLLRNLPGVAGAR